MIAWIGTALRRLRDERLSALGLAGFVFVTAFAAAAAPRLVDRMATDTLLATVAREMPASRNIQWLREARIGAIDGDPLLAVDAISDVLHAALPERVTTLVSERSWYADSGRWTAPEVVGDPATMRIRVQPDIDSRITLREGRWPTGATTKGPDRTPQAGPAPNVTFFEIAVSRATADGLGLVVGDTLILRTDLTDPLVGQGHKTTIGVTVVGTFDVNDEADAWWLGGTDLARPSIRSLGGDAKITDTIGLLSPKAYQAYLDETRVLALPVRYTFREFVDMNRLNTGAVDATLTDLRRLEAAYPAVNVSSIQTTALRTGLRGILEEFHSQWGAASVLLTVGVIGPAAVAVAALGLVAVLAAQRRRSALALARGRGASLTQVITAVVVEGALLAAPAAAVAVVLAMTLVSADPVAPSLAAAALVTVVAVVLLVLATVPATGGHSFGPSREPSIPRPPSTRRLIFEGLVVLLAVGGAALLRERGVRGASSAGELVQADPLIAAVPALIGIAAGLVAVRLFPLPMALMARLARRRRGLVPLLAMRRSMQATSSGPVLIVLLATATIAAFSSAVLVHLERASNAAAWHTVGAAYRMDSNSGSLPTGFDPAALPDAEAGAVAYVATMNIGTRNLRVDFVALAADAYDRVVAGTPADFHLPVDLFAVNPPLIPLVVSAAVAARPDGARPGDQFAIGLEGRTFQARVVAVREDLPEFSRSEFVVVASRDQIVALFPDAPMRPSIAFVRAPEGSGAAIRAAFLAEMPIGGSFTARADVTRDLRDSPASRAVVTGITAAAILAGVYAAIAFAAAVALAGAARAVEVAHLRTLGLNGRQAAGLVLLEHGPTVIAAFAAGLALGLGLLVVLREGLGLDALVGSRVDVPIGLETGQLVLVLGGIVAVVAFGLALGAWMQRGAAPMAAVRRGFE